MPILQHGLEHKMSAWMRHKPKAPMYGGDSQGSQTGWILDPIEGVFKVPNNEPDTIVDVIIVKLDKNIEMRKFKV
jgi:hypothetical protein